MGFSLVWVLLAGLLSVGPYSFVAGFYRGSASRFLGVHIFSEKTCEPDLGCFGLDGEWGERSINLVPNSMKKIGLYFQLFTRKVDSGEHIGYSDKQSITNSKFDPSKKTVAISHGFMSGGPAWFQPFVEELLQYDDINVISVDWGSVGGAKTLYNRATANTRVVGAALGVLISDLVKHAGADPSKFHLVGHSLGAHVCGYAGTRVQKEIGRKVGRITGLDPAEPNYETYSALIRLDRSDADFVDVIHTDGNSMSDMYKEIYKVHGGYGMRKPCGHADFYPNGGLDQPGCNARLLGRKKRDVNSPKVTIDYLDKAETSAAAACDHSRAVTMFIDSINECSSMGYRCSNMDGFYKRRCPADCKIHRCNKMGYHATKPSRRMTYYLMTSGTEPFCVEEYHLVTLLVGKAATSLKGELLVSMEDSNGLTSHKANFTLDGKTDEYVKTWWTRAPSDLKYLDVHWEEETSLIASIGCSFYPCTYHDFPIKGAVSFSYKTGEKQSFCGATIHNKEDKKIRLYSSSKCNHVV